MVEGTISGMINKPVCDSLFKPASWLSKIDFINHLVLFNNVLITVLAEKKGGKSSFAALLQSNLDMQIQSCTINLQPSYDPQTLLDEISTGFALDQQLDFSALVQQINDKKSQCLLLIDDAQFLEQSWIKDALAAIKHQGAKGYFHLCFIADYSIVSSLNQVAADYKDLIHTIELSGLNETETRTYIQYRARAENVPPALLTDQLLGKIYQATAGDLAKIHVNIGQYISSYMTPPSKNKFKSLRNTGLVACVALAAAGLGYTLSHNEKPSGIEKSKVVALKNKEVDSSPSIGIMASHAVVPSQIPSWREAATVNIVNPVSPPPLFSPPQTVVTEHRVRPSVIDPFPGFTSPKVKDKTSKPAAKKTLAASPADKKLFTIQLLASHKIGTIKNFVHVNHLKGKSKIYTLSEKNSQWFVLTLGEYDSREAAKAVMGQLPSRLIKLKPWIRTSEGLQKLV